MDKATDRMPTMVGPNVDVAILERVLRASRDVVCLIRLDGVCLYTSPSCETLIGYKPEELVGRSSYEHVHPDDVESVQAAMQRLVTTAQPLTLRFRMVHRNGTAIAVEASAQPPEPGWDSFGVGLRDNTERMELEQLLRHAAVHDPVTGLANRRLLDDELQAAVARAERSHVQLAVIFIDLDGFKSFNDTHGHATGDLVLRTVASRLGEVIREGDVAARYGGDEFVAVLVDMADSAEVGKMIDRLRIALTKPVSAPEGPLSVTASIGVAMWQPGMTGTDLLALADGCMYRAKHHHPVEPRVISSSTATLAIGGKGLTGLPKIRGT